MKYKYVKAPPGYLLEQPIGWGKMARYVLSLALLTTGVAVSTTVVYPLLNYQWRYAPGLQREQILSPLSGPPIKQVAAQEAPILVDEVVNTSLDYTDSSTWFTNVKPRGQTKAVAVSTISIPKLGIDHAVARNDHTDLKQSLIHYQGTAMPGDLGNAVIFGHSVLPQFFNPQNYLTIFSTLYRLEIGDKLEVESDGATYVYKVEQMYETTPDDLSPLAQSYGGRYLTLITCSPPGTYLRRLIIKAAII